VTTTRCISSVYTTFRKPIKFFIGSISVGIGYTRIFIYFNSAL
jgi:hypothetical protein